MSDETAYLAVLFLLVALLYAAVGQAGATGYLAAMSFFGLAPATMKTTALSLNLLVLGSLPQALPAWLGAVGVGGLMGAVAGSRYLPDTPLRYILAIVLLAAGVRLVLL